MSAAPTTRPATPADYLYDVFLSYKRHELTLGWTRIVLPRLQFWLSQELGGREARIFVDETCIEVGEQWPIALQHALRHSRCMVGVWLPSYFQSAWCVSEWRSFRTREEMLGPGASPLIAPMRFHDGEHFPQEARETQWLDVAPYACTLPGFWNTTKAMEFEDNLKVFAGRVATMVNTAPAFRPDWPLVSTVGFPAPTIQLEKL